MKNELSSEQIFDILSTLKSRFNSNTRRHENLNWELVEKKIKQSSSKLLSLYKMELSGGEPDVIGVDENTGEYLFCDCSKETPKGRRSICYDKPALDSRKEFKPKTDAIDMAHDIGIEILSEDEYRTLQKIEPFDTKSSSWIKTPDSVRQLGGALFAEYRYGKIFIFHNGAQSYYNTRGFRGLLKV